MYTCPMHPEVQQHTSGRCPKCGMKLVPQSQAPSSHQEKEQEKSYTPLFIILSLISVVTFSFALKDLFAGNFNWSTTMMNFMAGFFLVFSGFKLIDIRGFAEGYSTYDLIAQRIFSYGYVYPFLELGLGILFALHIVPLGIIVFTFLLMTLSGIGVAIKVAKHEKFQCACLGTFLKVPLTKVTLIEDFGMAAMALVMIFVK